LIDRLKVSGTKSSLMDMVSTVVNTYLEQLAE